MSSKTTKAGRRASFRYHVATKWVIRGEQWNWSGGLVPIPQFTPRGWKVRARIRGGPRLRAYIVNNAFALIEPAPIDATVTYELTPRR